MYACLYVYVYVYVFVPVCVYVYVYVLVYVYGMHVHILSSLTTSGRRGFVKMENNIAHIIRTIQGAQHHHTVISTTITLA